MIVYLNNEFLQLEEAKISPFDRGFLFADGVYESIRTYNGKLFYYKDHLKRLRKSLNEIRLLYNETEKIEPSKVIIFEGIFTLFDKEIRNMLDIKVFLRVDADIRFTRRLHRDVNERGRSLESVISQYYATVRPMYQKYLEPQKEYADFDAPDELSDVSWLIGTQPFVNDPFSINVETPVPFLDLSQGAVSHEWIIEEGNKYLKTGFRTNDSIFDEIARCNCSEFLKMFGNRFWRNSQTICIRRNGMHSFKVLLNEHAKIFVELCFGFFFYNKIFFFYTN